MTPVFLDFGSLLAQYSSKPIYIKAPAKLNLRLKVTGRRDDGYHLLSMLNVSTDLCDEISLGLLEKEIFKIELSERSSVPLEFIGESSNNLALVAAKSFFEAFGINGGVSIILTKNIPIGAGLGGGSSDAAAILRALRDIYFGALIDSGLEKSDLVETIEKIAVELGADVPYFLTGGFAHVQGIGEKVRPLRYDFLEGLECLLLLPEISISTREIFSLLRSKYPRLNQADDEGKSIVSLEELFAYVENDLEPIVFKAFPELEELMFKFRRIPQTIVSLSGSGSAFFVLSAAGKKFPKAVKERVLDLARECGINILETSFQHGDTWAK